MERQRVPIDAYLHRPGRGINPDGRTNPRHDKTIVSNSYIEPEIDTTLAVNDLTKRFGHKVAVDEISFYMKASEVVGLLGPNGAGKTTVFFMIAGFIDPSAGIVSLGKKNITVCRCLWKIKV